MTNYKAIGRTLYSRVLTGSFQPLITYQTPERAQEEVDERNRAAGRRKELMRQARAARVIHLTVDTSTTSPFLCSTPRKPDSQYVHTMYFQPPDVITEAWCADCLKAFRSQVAAIHAQRLERQAVASHWEDCKGFNR